MNIFQILADFCHMFANVYLLSQILQNKSYAGISAKSQILYFLVFSSRYLDLLISFISYYNCIGKILFVIISCLTVLMVFIYYDTYDKKNDSFYYEALIFCSMVLAIFFNNHSTPTEITWAFSQYLEAVTIIPQIYMILKANKITNFMVFYLSLLVVYKFLYFCNWIYKWKNEDCYFDIISGASGVVYIMIYIVSLCILCQSGVKKEKKKSGEMLKNNIFFVNFDYTKQNKFYDPLVKDGAII